MDHLEYGDVLKSKLGIQQFRCYCYDSIAEDLSKPPDFHLFADGRNGWILTLTGELERASSDSAFPDDATSFVQRWLYFGLLRELFYGIVGFNTEDFVWHDKTSYLLKTKALPRLLAAWSDSLKSSDTQWSRLTRAQDVLATAQTFILKLGSRTNRGNYPSTHFSSNIEDEAILSIIILGEALTTAVRKIQSNLAFEAPGWRFLSERSCGWGYTTSTLQAFYRNGWTEEAVEGLADQCMKNTNALLHALVHQLPPSVYQKTLDYRSYQYRHFCDDSMCSMVGLPDYEDVINIIEKGGVPLFQYTSESQSLLVQPRALNAAQRYVVISHVWADGFGNPSTNAMPGCVLDLFAKLFPVDVLPQECSYEHIEPQKTHLFWIDTLGVPVAKDLNTVRAKARSQQHSIFVQATATFVLDNDLLQQVKNDPCTIGMSIGLTNWTRRLCTLQDALLSRELFFVLHQETISSTCLDRRLDEYGTKLYECVSQVARQYSSWILWSMDVLDNSGGVKITNASILAQIWRAVQRREVSYPEHETTALVALFGFDTDGSEFDVEYLGIPNSADFDTVKRQDYLNRRMKAFIILLKRLQASIPAAFLFLPGPYLPFPGFRWAPRTWLTHIPAESIEHWSRDERSCSLTLEGLRGQLPGFRLHEFDVHVYPLKDLEDFYFPSDYTLQDWFLVAKMNNKSKPWFRGPHANIALVCQSHAIERQPQTALLVSILEFRNPQHQLHHRATILRRVQINKVTDPQTISSLREQFRHIRGGGIACYGEYLPKAEWILDGAEQTEDEIDSPTGMMKGDRPTSQTSTSWGSKVAAVAKFAGLLSAVRQRYGSPSLSAVNPMELVPSLMLTDHENSDLHVPTSGKERDGATYTTLSLDAEVLDSNQDPMRTVAAIRHIPPHSAQLKLQIPRSPKSDAATLITEVWDTSSTFSTSMNTRTVFSEPQNDKVKVFKTHATRLSNSSIAFRDPPQPSTNKEVISIVRKQADRESIEAMLQESWISELKDAGLSDEAILALLEEDQLDAPWIRFTPRPKADAYVYLDSHIPQCIHNWQLELRVDATQKEVLAPVRRNVSEFPDTIRDIYELCGLAGVLPEVDRHPAACRSVYFYRENTLACIDYTGSGDDHTIRDAASIWSEIKNVLDRFCHAIGLAQAANFCCDSFTIIVRSKDKLKMYEIPFENVLSLQEVLGSIRRPTDIQRSHRKRIFNASMQLLKHCVVFPLPSETPSIEMLQHYCALTAQILCLGFTSYIQAHLGLPEFFFLDTALQLIHLNGTLSSLEGHTLSLCIEASQKEITCLREGTQAPVFAFHALLKFQEAEESFVQEEVQTASHETKSLDVEGRIEDMIDTWGPAKLVWNDHDLMAIGILDGYIVSTGASKGHFELRLKQKIRAFDSINLDQTILIGRPATINPKCPWRGQELHCIQKTPGMFVSLGGSSDYWTFEPQIGLSGGLFATAHVNVISKKHEGTTWKREQLERFFVSDGINLNECLSSMWGLQVSYCTNVARRIPLHKVLAELIPKIYLPDSSQAERLWTHLEEHHRIFQVLQNNAVQELLPILDEESSKFLKKLILNTLMVLEPTGLNVTGDSITLAWPTRKDNQRSRVVSCHGDSSWIRLLRDTAKSATFAYISMECLETTDHECRGRLANPAWQDRILHLETEVGPRDILSHNQNYFFEQLSGRFVMRAEACQRHDAIRLFVPFLRTPTKIQARLQSLLSKTSCQLWERRNVLDAELQVSHVVVGQKTVARAINLHEIVAENYGQRR